MSTRRELVAARDEATQLVRVIVGIGSDLDLGVTLRRIVSAAVELSGARYGVLEIRESDSRTPAFVCEDSTETLTRMCSGGSRW